MQENYLKISPHPCEIFFVWKQPLVHEVTLMTSTVLMIVVKQFILFLCKNLIVFITGILRVIFFFPIIKRYILALLFSIYHVQNTLNSHLVDTSFKRTLFISNKGVLLSEVWTFSITVVQNEHFGPYENRKIFVC